MKISNYNKGFKLISLAKDDFTRQDLINDGLDFVFLNNGRLYLGDESTELDIDGAAVNLLQTHNNYDIYEIRSDGRIIRVFDTSSIDNTIFITGKCNSNCVMCPSPDYSRQFGQDADIDKLTELVMHIPSNTPHLTITGGEPFLSGEPFFKWMSLLRAKFDYTECLFLTNGRIFSIPKYAKLLSESIPGNSIIAIPIHGSNAKIHDAITRASGSFQQTLDGVKRLLALGIRIELRIVVSKVNCHDLKNLASLIVRELNQVDSVSVMAMEMTGNAYKNRDELWISYGEAFQHASEAIKKLIYGGIDVKLYNFPLCTVDPSLWLLSKKSISPEKVRYDEVCDKCRVRDSCGGVFAGTLNLVRNELKAIL